MLQFELQGPASAEVRELDLDVIPLVRSEPIRDGVQGVGIGYVAAMAVATEPSLAGIVDTDKTPAPWTAGIHVVERKVILRRFRKRDRKEITAATGLRELENVVARVQRIRDHCSVYIIAPIRVGRDEGTLLEVSRENDRCEGGRTQEESGN